MTERVTPERWADAQRWERDLWVRSDQGGLAPLAWLGRLLELSGLRQAAIGDDWNHWWRERFDRYAALPASFANALELGCGPYTNVRLVLDRCQIAHLYCSDPLARTYVRLRTSWLARAVREGRVMLDDHPAEDCPYSSDYFDLVVMINVLDHVRDADACVSQAMRVTKPGGMLVIGQDLTDAEDAARFPDIGHPIRLDHAWLDARLQRQFHPRLHRVLGRDEGRNPAAHYGTYLFIGEKRGRLDGKDVAEAPSG